MKPLSFYLEQIFRIGPPLGVVIYLLYNPEKSEFLFDGPLLDKITGVSSTLFGFLLAILTLIIQSDSPIIRAMKANESYERLISFNKWTVLLAIINALSSFVLIYAHTYLKTLNGAATTVIGVLNLGVFCLVIMNTFLFTLVFYQILEQEARLQRNASATSNNRNLFWPTIYTVIIASALILWIIFHQ